MSADRFQYRTRPAGDGNSLRVKLAKLLPVSVIRKGIDYYRLGRVEIDNSSDSEILAHVRGTSTYRVVLTWKGRHLRGHCTCPYFASGGICKHIWATFEEAL